LVAAIKETKSSPPLTAAVGVIKQRRQSHQPHNPLAARRGDIRHMDDRVLKMMTIEDDAADASHQR
jgi:hypothetical protein